MSRRSVDPPAEDAPPPAPTGTAERRRHVVWLPIADLDGYAGTRIAVCPSATRPEREARVAGLDAQVRAYAAAQAPAEAAALETARAALSATEATLSAAEATREAAITARAATPDDVAREATIQDAETAVAAARTARETAAAAVLAAQAAYNTVYQREWGGALALAGALLWVDGWEGWPWSDAPPRPGDLVDWLTRCPDDLRLWLERVAAGPANLLTQALDSVLPK